MTRASRLVAAALAGCAALTWAGAGYTQDRDRVDRREDRRDDRRDRRDDRRDDRRALPPRDRGPRDVDDRDADRDRAPERGTRETLKARSILGSKVSIRGGRGVGTVDDIIFTRDGAIDYLVVLDRDRYVLVPWEAARFDFGRRSATVEITEERFREVPTYTRERYRDVNFYDPGFRTRTYGYYGLRPGQERRMERRGGGPRR